MGRRDERAKRPGLRTDHAVGAAMPAPARAAVGAVAGGMLRRARQCEAGVCDDLDAEFLHDFRVHLRKARSVLALLKGVFPPETTRRLKRLLGDIARRTNRLRDDDVSLQRRAEYEAALPPEWRPGLGPLFAEWSAHRAAEHAAVARYLRSREYRDAIGEVERVLAHPESEPPTPLSAAPIGPLVFAALAKRHRRFVRLARDVDDGTSDDAIHRLRIEGKKLRSLLELTRGLLPEDERARLERPLRRLQDRLGAFNDLSVQRRALLARAATLDDPAQRLALDGLVGTLRERQGAERRKVFDRLAAVCRRRVRRWVRERLVTPKGEVDGD